MNRRSGFTLMELLLVVAVLAIVAAAAAPTFFGGAKQAMDEAKKAGFMSACTNALSGASMYLAIEASQGRAVADNTILPLDPATGTKFAPIAARTFKNAKSPTPSDVVITAMWNGSKVVLIYGTTAGSEPTVKTNIVTPDAAGWAIVDEL